jgi:tetratricopeptide (TPR) repeat protein
MNWYVRQGQFKEAKVWSTVIGSALRRASGSGDRNYEIRRAEWLREQCNLLFRKRQLDQAVQPCREAWEIASRSGDFEPLVETSSTVMGLYVALGRREEAEKIVTAMDEQVVRTLGEEHPARLVSFNNRAYIAGMSLDFESAGALSMQAARLGAKVAPGNLGTIVAQGNACEALARAGDPEVALPYCDLAIAGMLKAFGPDSDNTAEAHYARGIALLDLERYPDAVAEYEAAIGIYEKIGAAKHPTVVGALGGTGSAQLAMGQRHRAVSTLEHALAIAETIELNTPNDKVTVAEVRFALARALASSGAAPARIDQLASASADAYHSLGLEQRAREVTDWLGTRRDLVRGSR